MGVGFSPLWAQALAVDQDKDQWATDFNVKTQEISPDQAAISTPDLSLPSPHNLTEDDLIPGLTVRRSGPWSNALHGSPCCYTCPVWPGTTIHPGPRMVPLWPGTAPRTSGTRPPQRSSRVPAAAPLAELRPGRGDGIRPTAHRYRSGRLLLRFTQPLAVRHETKHLVVQSESGLLRQYFPTCMGQRCRDRVGRPVL